MFCCRFHCYNRYTKLGNYILNYLQQLRNDFLETIHFYFSLVWVYHRLELLRVQNNRWTNIIKHSLPKLIKCWIRSLSLGEGTTWANSISAVETQATWQIIFQPCLCKSHFLLMMKDCMMETSISLADVRVHDLWIYHWKPLGWVRGFLMNEISPIKHNTIS